MMTNGTETYIGRYCASCGKKHDKGVQACPSCGARTDGRQYDGVYRIGAGGIGYSHKTDDPIFTSNRKKFRKVTLILVPCIVLFIVLLLIVVKVKPAVALIVGAILLIITMPFVLLSFRKKSSWEGTVTQKKCSPWSREKRQETYKIYFETEDGKRKVQKWNLHPQIYDWLEVGDRVRYDGEIGGNYAFEKYDKSKDDSIACVSCGYLQDARQKYCTACGSPLLKGNPIR